ncbi:transposase [Candidatus Tisiphia endosymbiont of Dioctria rufipes]|uniref:transposase n=1 Tax=Candidatus Tisiphia endosymbiont of Dioctria rufipes TaxID=3066255 RepID=UPI0039774DA8
MSLLLPTSLDLGDVILNLFQDYINKSGKKIGKGYISGGKFYARKALYMAALVAMRYNRYLSKLYFCW